jgi:excisionase family DNA binding protein
MTKQSILITLTGEDLTEIVRRAVSDCLTEAKESEAESTPNDEYITIVEAAKLLNVHKRTIYNRVVDGRLTQYKIGRSTRVSREEVLALIKPVRVATA